MGNKHSRNNTKEIKRSNSEIKFKGKQIKGKTICPLCHKVFDSSKTIQQLNDHLIVCGKNYMRENQVCEIYTPHEDPDLIKLINKYNKEYTISPLTIKQKADIQLNTKIEELKKCIQSRKISWQDGCCNLEVNRNDLLTDSMQKIEKVDLFKELKINFLGELCYDAGGIFREWFTTLFKSLESEKLRLFVVSETQEFSYIINPFLRHNE